jgi:uncharacterized membrane protein YcaP (DUF421 family)
LIWVILLIISETVDASLIGDDNSLTGGLISAFTLVAIVQIMGYFTWWSKPIDRCVEGAPRILVRHGKVDNKVMADEQVTRSELSDALRREGCISLLMVRFAVLENDGSISVREAVGITRS